MKKGLRYLVVSVLLLGVFALNVSAAEENGCPGHGGAIAVGASQTLGTPNATYYLTNDITGVTKRVSDGITYYDGFNVTADNVTLCMNGYNIIPTQSAVAVRVADKVKGFVLCNCQSDRGGVVTGKGDNRSMLLMPGSEGGIFKGVHLDNNTTVTKSAAVQVNGNASFSMCGGSINNNGFTGNGYHNSGVTGALVGLGGSTINLIGGEILNNNLATASGATMIGSVVSNGGTVTMYDGFVISGNRFTNPYDAKSAGGVYVTNGTFTMNGGTITDNIGNTITESTDNCGGVYVTSGTFTMSGGTITNNTGDGGGVLLQNSTMVMEGGVISGNTATESGAGIAMTGRVSFSMSGGEVSGNKQAEKSPYEAQVALSDDKVGTTAFALSSGTISTEGKTENALVFYRGSATISGGTVNGTVATVGIGGPVALTISGGTINGRLSNKELPVSEMEFEEDCTISLTGGRFSDDTELDVLKGWLASGKTLTPMTQSGKIFYRTNSLSTSSCTCSGATKITSGTTISTAGSKYYVGNGWSLTNSYTLSGQIIVDADDVTLCLHNRNITSSSGAAIICKGKNLKIVNGSENRGTIKGATCAVQVMSGGSVTIGDNVHIDNATNLTTAPVVVEAGGSFTMAGGSISTNKFTASQTYAGGAILAAGDVMLNCGVISGNRLTVASGGFGSGAVTMTGGKLTMGKHVIISGNNSGGHGGGVALYNASAFDMVGGTISGNSADNTGGGVAVAAADARFNMTGGTISDNKASRWGGGVAVRMGEFNLSGGTIKDNDLTNSVHEYGNQITVGLWGDSTIGKFTMTGGEIIDTQADTTAGLKTSTDVTVCAGEAVISGGSITGQVSTVGVPIGSAALTISGGTINGEVINAVPLPTNASVAEQDTPEEMEAMRKDTTITITGGEFYGAIVETEHDNRKSATNTIISGGKFANFGDDARETLGSFLDDTKGILSVTEISEGDLDYEVRCGLVYNGAYMDFGSSLDFGLNLVADVGDWTEVSGYTLSLTGADADVEPEILIKEIEGSKQLFVMAHGIAAKEMRDDITFTLKKDGEVWFTKTMSVYDAADEFCAEERKTAEENGTEADGDYLAMLGNMIRYGTQAQQRFSYNLRTLLSKPDFAETSGSKAWSEGDVVVSDGDASKVRLSLSLKEQIELNFYIRDPQARISNVTFAGETIPASDYTVVQATGENDGYTMISFREIPITKAKEMAQFTVTLRNATTFDVSGGIASYIKLAQNDNAEAALVSALRNYVESVYTVFATVPEAPVAARVSVEEL